ncbi:predicted protein [Sclerotinia sclerotiorum 1980 UF-70]|uniref:Uncharacterized protein n=1 Tax=Sclerotinia sclerotiorum (strain ATCC 18683 / 1980 / Ss-1) TaxID=665079 RepID=A7EWB4_SCLS1|nr:predicted protein [Sclerotinia sclerotiorum 1980 UF-70]EDN93756.1 predicted protein [Sclerotinia sclerotiorum 1980 UF-70]
MAFTSQILFSKAFKMCGSNLHFCLESRGAGFALPGQFHNSQGDVLFELQGNMKRVFWRMCPERITIR